MIPLREVITNLPGLELRIIALLERSSKAIQGNMVPPLYYSVLKAETVICYIR